MPRLPADIRISLKNAVGGRIASNSSASLLESGDRYTSGIRLVCLYLPSAFLHARFMATLNGNSTDAEVWAAYDDNASYEEDASRARLWRWSPPVESCGDGFRSLPAVGRRRSPANRWKPRSWPPSSGSTPTRQPRAAAVAGLLPFDGELPKMTKRRRQGMAGST